MPRVAATIRTSRNATLLGSFLPCVVRLRRSSVPPSSAIGLLILVTALLPGASYTWAFERQAGAYGVSLADRTFRFIAVSLFSHILLGWPEYWLYRIAFSNSHYFRTGQFAAAWVGALLITGLPAVVGTAIGRLYVTQRKAATYKRLSVIIGSKPVRLLLGSERAPRAWDDLFNERPTFYVRLRTTNGSWLAGLFADQSYVGAYPNDADLYLEQAWSLDENKALGPDPLGYSLYIPSSQIAWLEIIRPQNLQKVLDKT
jgi:hypothetical protein